MAPPSALDPVHPPGTPVHAVYPSGKPPPDPTPTDSFQFRPTQKDPANSHPHMTPAHPDFLEPIGALIQADSSRLGPSHSVCFPPSLVFGFQKTSSNTSTATTMQATMNHPKIESFTIKPNILISAEIPSIHLFPPSKAKK